MKIRLLISMTLLAMGSAFSALRLPASELSHIRPDTVLAFIQKQMALPRVGETMVVRELVNYFSTTSPDARITKVIYKQYGAGCPHIFFNNDEIMRLYPENVLAYIADKQKLFGITIVPVLLAQIITYFHKQGNMPVVQVLYIEYGRQYPALFAGKGCITYVKNAVVKGYVRGTLGHIQRRTQELATALNKQPNEVEKIAICQTLKQIVTGNIHGVWTCEQKWRVLEVIMKRYAKQYGECILQAVTSFEKDACLQEVVDYLHTHKLLAQCAPSTLQAACQSAVRQFLPCRALLGAAHDAYELNLTFPRGWANKLDEFLFLTRYRGQGVEAVQLYPKLS